MSCFDDCSCKCEQEDLRFNEVITNETKFKDININSLTHLNIGWFTDESLGSTHLINAWELSGKFGVYILWHKSDYCEKHDRYHMKALYVGKGEIERRLYNHWKWKDFSDELLVYWTYQEMSNRKAKYCEQLLLDIFRFPHNTAENYGNEPLCAHFTQNEVD